MTLEAISVNTDENISLKLNKNAELICSMAGAKEFQAGADISKPQNAATAIVDEIQIYVHNVIDIEAERIRLEKQKQQIEKGKQSVEAKLANTNFVTKAKPEVVAQAQERLSQLTEQLETITKHLLELEHSE